MIARQHRAFAAEVVDGVVVNSNVDCEGTADSGDRCLQQERSEVSET